MDNVYTIDLESKDISLLVPDFRVKVETLLAKCQDAGYDFRPIQTVRGPAVQGALWCRSRSANKIAATMQMLIDNGAPGLAALLDSKFAQTGKWATDALPGQSWHQYGLAVDCALFQGKRIEWNAEHKGYYYYASKARELGLESGHYWPSRDSVHVQGVTLKSPQLGWVEIEKRLRKMYTF